VLGHASEEHLDYQMLERDYVSVGGDADAIRSGTRNAGTEALSAWMLQQASRPNPIALLGAMFIIEGTGRLLAGRLAANLSARLTLPPEQSSFLTYHSANDDAHLGKLVTIVRSGILNPALAREVVRTAEITGRLYCLQLEELDRC
jgi:3-oxoacyl-[acyl-carrier-protein] synthase-3